MLFYVQCMVRKLVVNETNTTTTDRYKVTTTWLPEKYAKLHKWLKLKNRAGQWENHWQVITLGARKPENLVKDKERDYLDQREASDV